MTTVENVRTLRGVGSRRDTARRRVIFLPHAGGCASAYLWAEHFPDDVEVCAVQLPGRENRFGEAPLSSMAEVVDEVAPAIAARTDLPYVLFGHSMGALVAYAVTRRLAEQGAPLPRRLFVSAHRAPHLPDRDPLRDLPDDEFVARMPQSDLARMDPELRALFLPMVRADITVCETWAHPATDPLPVPVTALGGRDDDLVTEAELAPWREHTGADFAVELLPGGHFYPDGAETVLAERIRRGFRLRPAQKGTF